tara:strand:- start:505 stop:702 length:198 start_codon:yes stop_codon:yes gene_type:complete
MTTITYSRYSVDDIVINKEYAHLLDKYIRVKDEEGNLLAELQVYFIEDEEFETEEPMLKEEKESK